MSRPRRPPALETSASWSGTCFRTASGRSSSSATLIVGLAILTESVLGFLGFGIQPPTPTLGKLIADGQGAGTGLWWLVTFPGLTIVLILLCVNFVGDGLRDALDPTQRRVRE